MGGLRHGRFPFCLRWPFTSKKKPLLCRHGKEGPSSANKKTHVAPSRCGANHNHRKSAIDTDLLIVNVPASRVIVKLFIARKKKSSGPPIDHQPCYAHQTLLRKSTTGPVHRSCGNGQAVSWEVTISSSHKPFGHCRQRRRAPMAIGIASAGRQTHHHSLDGFRTSCHHSTRYRDHPT
jgi:hypothetical protein